MNIAVVDIGTNSIHMLIVRLDADLTPHVIDKAKEMVRLGQGTFEQHRLDEKTRARALDALVRFRRLADRRGVEEIIAVATSAVREADNGGAFLQEVHRVTGIHPRLIPGVEEARLVFAANRRTLPADGHHLVVDLGGGSAEFAVGTRHSMAWAESEPLGVQRMSAMILRDGEVDSRGLEAARRSIASRMAPIAARASAAGIGEVVVTSGSAGSFLKMARARGDADADGQTLTRATVRALAQELYECKAAERAKLPGLDRNRRDLVLGAAVFFETLMSSFDIERMRVSERALREGLLEDFVARRADDLQWELTEPNLRRRAVLRLGERLHFEAGHAQQVAFLAGRLFDQMRDLHGLDEAAGEWLEYAALLHDVGVAVNARGHHKHSEYLVLHALPGPFTPAEVQIVAAIARYHRKAEPRASHANWAGLGPAQQAIVARAGAILRLADGLDRSHAHAVYDVHVHDDGSTVTLDLEAGGPVELEMWATLRKGGWFRSLFARDLVVRPAVDQDSDVYA